MPIRQRIGMPVDQAGKRGSQIGLELRLNVGHRVNDEFDVGRILESTLLKLANLVSGIGHSQTLAITGQAKGGLAQENLDEDRWTILFWSHAVSIHKTICAGFEPRYTLSVAARRQTNAKAVCRNKHLGGRGGKLNASRRSMYGSGPAACSPQYGGGDWTFEGSRARGKNTRLMRQSATEVSDPVCEYLGPTEDFNFSLLTWKN